MSAEVAPGARDDGSQDLRLSGYAATDVGRVRENNEDAHQLQIWGGSDAVVRCLAVVADGVGGAEGGEVASGAAVELVRAGIEELAGRMEDGSAERWREEIGRLVGDVHRGVQGRTAEAGKPDSATTLTFAVIVGNWAHVGHVGDSRLYLIREGGVTQVTGDQTWVARQVEAGQMTESEAGRSERRSELDQAIGHGESVEAECLTVELVEGDWLVLCSDGLSEYVGEAELCEAIEADADPVLAGERLVAMARNGGGTDNITVVIVGTAASGQAVAEGDARPGGLAARLMDGLRRLVLGVPEDR